MRSGTLQVLGAIAYAFVVLRVAAWLPAESGLAAVILVTGVVGVVGNAAYGFDAIHQSFGDVELVDRSGAANLIKPLGLFVPISFALIALALAKLGRRPQGLLVLVAAVLWPIAHIANLGPVAVITNVGLVVAFGSLVWSPPSSTAT